MDVVPIGPAKGAGKQQKRRHGRGANRQDRAIAAIDVGTNNCRLLIARPQGNDFKVIDSFSRIVRLGEGLGQTNRLCPAAIERTIEALKICAEKVARHNDIRLRSVATEACRRAANGPDFLARVRLETGIRLEAISCEEEASLTLTGVRPLMDRAKPYVLVFDIGGGSTEVMWVRQDGSGLPEVIDVLSVPDGVVTLAERYGQGALPSYAYDDIKAHIDSYLCHFDEANNISHSVAKGEVQMIGTSGTVTTLGGIHLRLNRYNRRKVDGLTLDFDAIHAISSTLAGQDMAERAKTPCVGTERADLVVMGCGILEAITRRWSVGELRVADRGIREGLLVELMSNPGGTDRR